jgi:mRNA interferase MazF
MDVHSVSLEQSDFSEGGLNRSSRIRPSRIFTADDSVIVYRAGRISEAKLDETIDRLTAILRQS